MQDNEAKGSSMVEKFTLALSTLETRVITFIYFRKNKDLATTKMK